MAAPICGGGTTTTTTTTTTRYRNMNKSLLRLVWMMRLSLSIGGAPSKTDPPSLSSSPTTTTTNPYLKDRLAPFHLDLSNFASGHRGLQTLIDRRPKATTNTTTTGPKEWEVLRFSDREPVHASRCLSHRNDLQQAALHAANVLQRPLTDETILASYLCLEQRDPTNNWFTLYRSTLPRDKQLLLPLCLQERDVLLKKFERCLPGCYWDAMKASRSYVQRQHRYCVEALVPAGVKEELLPSPEDFYRAFAMIRSRSFAISDQFFKDEEKEEEENDETEKGVSRYDKLITQQSGTRRVLLPFYDLLNHQNGAKARIEKRLNTKTNTITWHILSQDERNAGDEIYNSYGDHRGNLELLLVYGFCDPNNGGRRIAFNRRNLLKALIESRLVVFGDPGVVQSLTKRLYQEEETLRNEPSQNLALYPIDLINGEVVCGEGLKAVLDTFQQISVQLGSSKEEAESLSSDVIDAMLRARLVELDECLDRFQKEEANANGGEKDSKGETEVWWREQNNVLLRAEREAIGNVLLQ